MDMTVTVLLLVGAVLLVMGYVKRNRNVMLLAGILLIVAAVLPDFTSGFMAGWRSVDAAGAKH